MRTSAEELEAWDILMATKAWDVFYIKMRRSPREKWWLELTIRKLQQPDEMKNLIRSLIEGW